MQQEVLQEEMLEQKVGVEEKVMVWRNRYGCCQIRNRLGGSVVGVVPEGVV